MGGGGPGGGGGGTQRADPVSLRNGSMFQWQCLLTDYVEGWCREQRNIKAIVNPFTATGCRISGLKSARTSLQNSTFSGPIANLFSIVCVLTEILSCQCETANKQT